MTSPQRYFRIAALVFTALLYHTPVFAGSNYVGFRGGVTWSTLKGDESADVSSVTRGVGGIAGVFGLTSWLYFQPELLWVGKGTEGTIPIRRFFGEDAVTGHVALNYLEIPLLLRFVPVLDDRWCPYLYGGPGVAANLSAEADGSFADGTPAPIPPDGNIDDIITDGDLLLIAGIGLDIRVKRLLFELDGRYESGLLTVEESRFSPNPKNRTWMISGGLLFTLGE